MRMIAVAKQMASIDEARIRQRQFRRNGCAVLLLLLCMLAFKPSSSSAACPSNSQAVLLIGIAGSGAGPDKDAKTSAWMSGFRSQIGAGWSIDEEVVHYPHAPVPFADAMPAPKRATAFAVWAAHNVASLDDYIHSAWDSAPSAAKQITTYASACPTAGIAIEAYSQGGIVLRRAIQLTPTPVRKRILSITLLADPTLDPGTTDQPGRIKDLEMDARGVAAMLRYMKPAERAVTWSLLRHDPVALSNGIAKPYPEDIPGIIRSWCLGREDPVCNLKGLLADCASTLPGKTFQALFSTAATVLVKKPKVANALAKATALALWSTAKQNGQWQPLYLFNQAAKAHTTLNAKPFGSQAARDYLKLSKVIAAGPPQITTATLMDASVGTAYAVVLTTADNRNGTWASAPSGLPPGLSLSADGKITGTPSASGLYAFTVGFTDIAGASASKPLSIKVDPATGVGGGSVSILSPTDEPFGTFSTDSASRWLGPLNDSSGFPSRYFYDSVSGAKTPLSSDLTRTQIAPDGLHFGGVAQVPDPSIFEQTVLGEFWGATASGLAASVTPYGLALAGSGSGFGPTTTANGAVEEYNLAAYRAEGIGQEGLYLTRLTDGTTARVDDLLAIRPGETAAFVSMSPAADVGIATTTASDTTSPSPTPATLYLFGLDSRASRQVPLPAGSVEPPYTNWLYAPPVWSDDGSMAAFYLLDGASIGVYVLDIASGTLRKVSTAALPAESAGGGLAFSHDGRAVAYWASLGGYVTVVARAPVNGSGAVQISPTFNPLDVGPIVPLGGGAFATVGWAGVYVAGSSPGDWNQIVTPDATMRIYPGPIVTRGGRIYFWGWHSATITSNATVWSVAADGSDLRQLIPNNPAYREISSFFVSADGTRVVGSVRIDDDNSQTSTVRAFVVQS